MLSTPSTENLLRKLTTNASFNSLNHFWSLAVGILLTPYILHHLGTELYATWALINVLLGYANLTDMGLGTSFVKYIAQYHAKNESNNLNCLINTGLSFYGVLGAVVAVLALSTADWALRFLNIPPELLPEATLVLQISVFAFVCNNLGSVFNAVQHGLQRLDINTKLKLGLSIPQLLGTIYVLEMGYGLPGLVINTTIWALAHNAIAIVIAYHLLPTLKLSVKYVKKAFLKEMLQYGSKLHASRLSSMINFHYDKVLITKLSALNFVTYYDIGSKVITNLRSVFLSLIQVIMPAVSELDARGEREQIGTLYLKTTKFLILLSLPCYALSVSAAQVIIEAWVGLGFDHAILALRLLTIGYFANLLGATVSFVVQGIGKPEIQMRTAILSLTLNIVLSAVFFFVFGFSGIMLGTSTAMTVAVVYYFFQFSRSFEQFRMAEIFGLCIKPLVASAIGSCAILAINQLMYEPFFQSTRLFRLEMLAIDSFCFFAIYIPVILVLGYLTTEDKALIKRVIGRKF